MKEKCIEYQEKRVVSDEGDYYWENRVICIIYISCKYSQKWGMNEWMNTGFY